MATTVGPLLGRGYKLYVNAVAVARVTSSSLESSANAVDVSNKDSGRNSEFLAGRTSHTASAEAIFSNDLNSLEGYETLWSDFMAGNIVDVVISNEVVGDKEWAFGAIITGLPIEFPDDESVTFSIEFQVTGAVTLSTVA